MTVKKEVFGKSQFNEDVDLFTLENRNGLNVRIMNYGGIIVSIETPDKNGGLADIVLGYDAMAGYLNDQSYFGAVIGRYANRIKEGKFTLDGTEYTLAVNNGPNALHGGLLGFDKVIWNTELLTEKNTLRMMYISADGEEGFPGEVKTAMTYTLTDANELKIGYTAESTKATPYNITNHSYFNLAGHDAGCYDGQHIMINADTILPANETSIPYGNEMPVDGTPFDFRTP